MISLVIVVSAMDRFLSRKVLQSWVFTIIWSFLILSISVVPVWSSKESSLYGFDKIGHFLGYLVLAVFMIRSVRYTAKISFIKNFSFTLIFCGVYGILIELVQLVIPGRMADVYDVVANIFGVICGAILVRTLLW